MDKKLKAVQELSSAIEHAGQVFLDSCMECGFVNVVNGLANALEDVEPMYPKGTIIIDLKYKSVEVTQ